MNILVIEDEQTIRQTLQDLLELNGHVVAIAKDGHEGLTMAEAKPDLILCDIQMPGLDGFHVVKSIREHAGLSDTPFIFLTARTDHLDQRRGMSQGADDYLTKPFTEKELLDAIAARIRRHAPLRDRITRLLNEKRTLMDAAWRHELMTPLNGILGGLQLIEAEIDSIQPDELKHLLALIRTGAQRHEAFSRKLVLYYELERMIASRTQLSATEVDAKVLVTSAVTRVAKAEARSEDMVLRCVPGILRVSTGHLIAALSEIVENACRFSPAGQHVVVIGSQHDDRYVIQVTDRGIGMTPDQQAHIAPFTQFDRSKNEQQGIGLGLSIARMITEMSGGRLTVRHAPEGKGLQVVFELPTY